MDGDEVDAVEQVFAEASGGHHLIGCGLEPGLYENLRSFCVQNGATVQTVFAAREADDPALAVARRLQQDLPGSDITLVAGRLPRNHEFAGKQLPGDLLPPAYRKQGLRFTETGFPDFEPYAVTLPNGQKYVEMTFGQQGKERMMTMVSFLFLGTRKRGWKIC